MSGGEKKMEHSKKITIKVILLIYIMLMIVRITLSNILSLTFVVLISRFAKKKKHSETC